MLPLAKFSECMFQDPDFYIKNMSPRDNFNEELEHMLQGETKEIVIKA